MRSRVFGTQTNSALGSFECLACFLLYSVVVSYRMSVFIINLCLFIYMLFKNCCMPVGVHGCTHPPHDDSSSPLDLPLVYNRELQLNTMRLLEKVASLPKLSIFNKISS